MRTIAIALLFAGAMLGQTKQECADAGMPTVWETKVGGVPSAMVIPNSVTPLITPSNGATSYVRVGFVNLTNITAGTVTVTFTDASTNCNSGVCNLLPSGTPLTIAAGTTYTVNLQLQPAVGGVKWSASSANAVHGWVKGCK